MSARNRRRYSLLPGMPLGIQGDELNVSFTYVNLDEFAADQSAPLTSPRAGEIGTTTITDTQNRLSVSGGKLVSVSGTAVAVMGTTITAVAGRCLQLLCTNVGTRADIYLGTARIEYASGIRALGGAFYGFTMGSSVPRRLTILYLQNGGTAYFLDKDLVFVSLINTASGSLTHKIESFNTFNPEYERFVIADLGFPFTQTYGFALLNEASPAGSYTVSADAHMFLTVTAPGSLSDEAGFRWRVTDSNNYWRAYFDAAGAFKVDSVSGGVATNRINVAGVIAGGNTRTIQIMTYGTRLLAMTAAGTVLTIRGSELNVSHNDAATGLEMDVAAGWTASNLIVYPRSSTFYDVMEQI